MAPFLLSAPLGYFVRLLKDNGGMIRRKTPKSSTSVTTTLPLFEVAKHRLRETAQSGPRFHMRDQKWSTTGLLSVDQAMRGGFLVGATTLVASRPRAGGNSLLLGALLANVEAGYRVAYYSERLPEEQIRGRLVVLKSKVNGHRFRAGVVSQEDRRKLDDARGVISWNQVLIRSAREVSLADVDSDIFAYRPQMVIADIRPRASNHSKPRSFDSLLGGINELTALAKREQIALVVRCVLPDGVGEPERMELPGLGTIANNFDSVLLLHREKSQSGGEGHKDADMAQAKVIRVAGRDVGPRYVNLRFDQRYAGLQELG